jgi:peptidoglycan/LPS O-acetylase OafA/YrhL
VALILVWVSSYQKGYLFCPVGLSKVLEWIGSRSYALYVIHICAYHFSVELWTRYATAQGLTLDKSFTLELVLTAIFFMVIGSELNYRLVEQPLRRKGAEIARRRLHRFTGERPTAAHPTTETASRGELA